MTDVTFFPSVAATSGHAHGVEPGEEPGGGHGHHHHGVFPGQPPAYVLPKAEGPGVTQPPDLPDTAKGDRLPHWDGVLIGNAVLRGEGGNTLTNLYVNGAFNYLDHRGSVAEALEKTRQLTAGPERPAAVLWRDKFGVVHAQALLAYGGIALDGGAKLEQRAPVAAHLKPHERLSINLGHPEALYIVDGDVVVSTAVNAVTPVLANGALAPALPENHRSKVEEGMARLSMVVPAPDTAKLTQYRLDAQTDVYVPAFFLRAGGRFFTQNLVDGVWRKHYAW